MKLSEIARMKTLAFEAEFFNKKNIENYVKMIEEIWKNKNVNVFENFTNNLKEIFSEEFVFEEDFSDFTYSHTSEIVYVILLVTFLTALEIKKMDEDSEAKIFTIIKTFDPEDKPSEIFLNDIFESITKLYGCFEKKIQEESVNI